VSYTRSSYGSSNPNAGRPANGDRSAWGGFAWPNGVPAALLGVTGYTSSFGQHLVVQMRREIVPLWNLAFEIIDRKHRYKVWAIHDGEAWGPWGYENRAVSGTNYPSGHSMGLSVDINAPYNPYARLFESDMPPAMVKDLESLGLYWGGRYENQKYDAMHYGYCFPATSVAGHIAKARQLLGQPPTPVPPPRPPGPSGVPKARKTAFYNPAGRKPKFPLASGHSYGVTSGPATQHSGDPRYDNDTTRKNIRYIQSYLNAISWYSGGIDGRFGKATESVVKRFQKAYTGPTGRLAVDGVVGARTWNAMGLRV
jgi:hypothetical protein